MRYIILLLSLLVACSIPTAPQSLATILVSNPASTSASISTSVEGQFNWTELGIVPPRGTRCFAVCPNGTAAVVRAQRGDQVFGINSRTWSGGWLWALDSSPLGSLTPIQIPCIP